MPTVLEQLSEEIGAENPITAEEFKLFVDTQRANLIQNNRATRQAELAVYAQDMATPLQLRIQQLQSEMNLAIAQVQKIVAARDAYSEEIAASEAVPASKEMQAEFTRRIEG